MDAKVRDLMSLGDLAMQGDPTSALAEVAMANPNT
jgi:hypothetical protein